MNEFLIMHGFDKFLILWLYFFIIWIMAMTGLFIGVKKDLENLVMATNIIQIFSVVCLWICYILHIFFKG